MKQTTSYRRAVVILNKIFNAVNEYYFANELEPVTVTIQSSKSTYGHITTSRRWTNENGEATYEINISAEYLQRDICSLVATMIHECSHLYNMQNGINDVSANGFYHNKAFKKTAEEIGHLNIEKHPQYGWTITHPTAEGEKNTLDFVCEYGFDDILVSRTADGFWFTGTGTATGTGTGTPRIKKPSSTRKYKCPVCGNSTRCTKDINIICGDCLVPFVKVS